MKKLLTVSFLLMLSTFVWADESPAQPASPDQVTMNCPPEGDNTDRSTGDRPSGDRPAGNTTAGATGE